MIPGTNRRFIQKKERAEVIAPIKAFRIIVLVRSYSPIENITAIDPSGLFFVNPQAVHSSFYHFIVGPEGGYWDSTNSGVEDTSYDPLWERAATVGEDAWFAEVAIPWGAIGMSAPEPGRKIRGNICRQRFANSELSTWSSTVEGFLETSCFGTWTLE